MPYVADLLVSGSWMPFSLLAGPPDAVELTAVTAVETLEALQRAPAGALTVITSRASTNAAGWQVDIAIRTASERGIPALLLIGSGPLPLTAVHLAERAALAVLTVPPECDVAEVVLQLGQVIRGDAAHTIARAESALAALRSPGESTVDLLERVSAALGRTLALDGTAEGEPIWVAGRRQGSLVGPADDAVRLVMPAVAAAISRQQTLAMERETAIGQSRSDLVTELIVSERTQAVQLAERARVLGLPIDDMHTVIRLATGSADSSGPSGSSGPELAERRRLFDTLTLHVHQARHPARECWNLAWLATDIVLVGTARSELPESRVLAVIAAARSAAAAEHPTIALHFGIGTAQRGIDGLRQSAMEAGAAVVIASRKLKPVHAFDATGLNRILAGISGSSVSRRVIDDLLAPLDALGSTRAAESITTLSAYLDARGSLKSAATRLRLHPNAVSYRIRRITERLSADLTDPDVAFALHLACRVRLHDFT